ncbi:MAG: deoxynucleoside kinase [Candidatus Gracilibacteria bacterium]|nr:deoxynucleoside kinase [Candidatus Gracilibacteria bacterium]
MFIVIDGIDGSGKGTQVKLISEYLESIGKKVKVLDYPRYDEQSSFMVKKYLNGEYGKEVSAKLASIFYAIDRYESSFDIRKDFADYDYIISNRYVSASMIHQTGKIEDPDERKAFLDWEYDLEYNIFGIPKADRVIFLDVPPDVSQKLLATKEKRDYIKNDKNLDIHEADKNHLLKSREAAIQVCDMYDDWTRLNCTKNGEMMSIEEIKNMILAEIL